MEQRALTELPDGRELYRLNFKARPTERHPLFEKSACGILSIWIFAESIEDAVISSRPFRKVLPFEVTSEEAEIVSDIAPPNEAYGVLVEMVELVGFSAYYEAYDNDADERDVRFVSEQEEGS